MNVELNSEQDHSSRLEVAGLLKTAVYGPSPGPGDGATCRKGIVIWDPPHYRALLVRCCVWGMILCPTIVCLVEFTCQLLMNLRLVNANLLVRIGTPFLLLLIPYVLFCICLLLTPWTVGPTSAVAADENGLAVRTRGAGSSFYWDEIAGLAQCSGQFSLYSRSGEITPINLSGYSWKGRRMLSEAIINGARLVRQEIRLKKVVLHSAEGCEFAGKGFAVRLVNPTSSERREAREKLVRELAGDRVIR